MIAVDSNVAVAAFSAWHERHATALGVLAQRPAIPAHALLEAFSVLTRMPEPFTVKAEAVNAFFELEFPAPPLTLDPAQMRELPRRLTAAGLRGGEVYDGLIGATAAAHDAKLISFDHTRGAHWTRLGVDWELR